MTNFPKATRYILLAFGLLACGSGCHVLSIPVDPATGLGVHSMGLGYDGECLQAGPAWDGEPHYRSVDNSCDVSCPPDWLLPLPERPAVSWPVSQLGWPVPKWWVEWRAKRDLPDAPAYPRFHPLPTRPMFQPRSMPAQEYFGTPPPVPAYGELPSAPLGRGSWQSPPASGAASAADTLPGQ